VRKLRTGIADHVLWARPDDLWSAGASPGGEDSHLRGSSFV